MKSLAKVMNYIWSNKRPRIKFKNLQDSKERGSQVALNFRLCYHAGCLTWISEWIIFPYGSITSVEGALLLEGLHKY